MAFSAADSCPFADPSTHHGSLFKFLEKKRQHDVRI